MASHLKVVKWTLSSSGHSHKQWPMCNNFWVSVIIIVDSLFAFRKWPRHLHYWPEKISTLCGDPSRKLLSNALNYYCVLPLFFVYLIIIWKRVWCVTRLTFALAVFWNNLTRWLPNGIRLNIIPSASLPPKETTARQTKSTSRSDSA